jgi:hypothetical protein
MGGLLRHGISPVSLVSPVRRFTGYAGFSGFASFDVFAGFRRFRRKPKLTGSMTLKESTLEKRISDFVIFSSGFFPFPASIT